ncbi:MAG: hypothetical protein ACYCWW_14465 [Deltaproteobacteria bacterium]
MPTASAVAMPRRKQGAQAPIAPHPLAFARLHGRPLVVHVAFEPSWLSQNPRGRGWLDALREHPDLTLREDDGSPCDVLHYVGFDPSFVLRARHADRALVTFGLSDDPASVWRRFPPAVTRLWAKLVSAVADGVIATSAEAARSLLDAQVSAPVRTVSLDAKTPMEPLAALYDLVACGKLQRRPWWQAPGRKLLRWPL